uniref:Putative secreted protein n=1 Tax=Anopheles darlingi TaxID=43151 RepID=A0A2M4DJ68_ANODA
MLSLSLSHSFGHCACVFMSIAPITRCTTVHLGILRVRPTSYRIEFINHTALEFSSESTKIPNSAVLGAGAVGQKVTDDRNACGGGGESIIVLLAKN